MNTGRPITVRLGVVAWVLLSAVFTGQTAFGQEGRPDGTGPTATATDRTPGGALRRSVVLPGWGQVYNGQPIKAPILIAAIGGLAYAVVELNSEYKLYRRAYQYKAFQERVEAGTIEENPHSDYASSYELLADRLGGNVTSGPLLTHRDALRRNRDLSIMGIGLVWAIGALDAYVNAHLLDFDVGENLSLRIVPSAGPQGKPSVATLLVWHPGR